MRLVLRLLSLVVPCVSLSTLGFLRVGLRSGLGLGSGSGSSSNTKCSAIPRDVVIVGGGLSGLSVAYHVALRQSRQVTVISRDDEDAIASVAAAGMLAPESERLRPSKLLDACLEAREYYQQFVEGLEGRSGVDVGFVDSGGFVAPSFPGDNVGAFSSPVINGNNSNDNDKKISGGRWLDQQQILSLEPQLGRSVQGGYWFPGDKSCDPRMLLKALREACEALGVEFLKGSVTGVGTTSKTVSYMSYKFDKKRETVSVACNDLVVANGAWMRELLPVPIEPHKGQSFSVKPPVGFTLSRVLFAQDTYIVPKSDGRIVVGSTVEPGAYDGKVTVGGLMHCFSAATRLLPKIAEMEIEETWAGLRPTTPDKMPIFGKTMWDNVWVAGGYWRNGVLLAPLLGKILSEEILCDSRSGSSSDYLEAFSWERFIDEANGGTKMAVEARYAREVNPVNYRDERGDHGAQGELGAYETADKAVKER